MCPRGSAHGLRAMGSMQGSAKRCMLSQPGIEGVSRWGPGSASLCRAASIGPVGARVDVAGLGIRLPARRLRLDWLRSKIPEAMTKPDRAGWLAQGFPVADGAEAASCAFETHLLPQSRQLTDWALPTEAPTLRFIAGIRATRLGLHPTTTSRSSWTRRGNPKHLKPPPLDV